MAPERFEDLLDAFDPDEGDEAELARAFREQVVDDLVGAKRLLEEGDQRQAEERLEQVLRNARTLLDEAPGRADPAGGEPPTQEQGAYRVIVADGNETRRSLHRTLLEEAGPFDVVAEATEEPRILDAVRAGAPDLLLLSVAAPDEESLAALREVKDAAPEVRLAVLPSFADEEFDARARDAGVDLCLDRELGGAEVVDRLQQLLAEGPDGT